jgi:hypothetical protein
MLLITSIIPRISTLASQLAGVVDAATSRDLLTKVVQMEEEVRDVKATSSNKLTLLSRASTTTLARTRTSTEVAEAKIARTRPERTSLSKIWITSLEKI